MDAETNYREITRNGLWDNNIVFAQMLALCPLLAVTGTAVNGLGMGLATLVVLALSGMSVAAFRDLITPEVRIPVFVLLIAGIVTIVDLTMNAWVHELHKVLGLFIPLIVTNCAILGRAESFASRYKIRFALFDGIMMGVGFTFALVIVGAVREIIGSGTLFANMHLLLGHSFEFMEMQLIPHYGGFLLAILPPGGFLVMGFLLAGKRLLDKRLADRQSTVSVDDKSTASATA
jgi:electron transport complex protein RnfE